MTELLLFTRIGCCLCQGLEERLRALVPAPPLRLIDVDDDPELRARYDLLVPVLALAVADAPGGSGDGSRTGDGSRQLPQVPPRLAGERLRDWLQRHGVVWHGPD